MPISALSQHVCTIGSRSTQLAEDMLDDTKSTAGLCRLCIRRCLEDEPVDTPALGGLYRRLLLSASSRVTAGLLIAASGVKSVSCSWSRAVCFKVFPSKKKDHTFRGILVDNVDVVCCGNNGAKSIHVSGIANTIIDYLWTSSSPQKSHPFIHSHFSFFPGTLWENYLAYRPTIKLPPSV